MNDQIKKQLEHRSIRKFGTEKVSEEMIAEFKNVISQTATSSGLQYTSVIRITDQAIKDEISKVCGQEYVAKVPELFIFIIDLYRNKAIAAAAGSENLSSAHDMNRFFQAYADALLAAQNLTNAVEASGLGAVFLGSILNDQKRIIELLELPELCFPAVGVAFGHPAEDPELKPRMPEKLRFFENKYKTFDDYAAEIADYDAELRKYFETRKENRRSESFSEQVCRNFSNISENRARMLKQIAEQGFDLKVD